MAERKKLTHPRSEACHSTQGKDPSSGARRRKRVSSGCGRDSPDSSRVESGVSGNYGLSFTRNVKGASLTVKVHNKKYENGKRKTLIGKGRYVAKIVDQQIIKLS